MTTASDEIYRDKYLKYKKKYTAALENMKGGDLSLPTDKPLAVYIVHQETYEFAQKIFPKAYLSDEQSNIRSIPPKFSKIFEEIFKIPHDGLKVLPLTLTVESASTFSNNKFKFAKVISYVSGEILKKPYKDNPTLSSIFDEFTFGEIRELDSSNSNTFVKKWDSATATEQLTGIKNYLITWINMDGVVDTSALESAQLDEEAALVTTATTPEQITKIFVIARVNDNLHFCGEI
jgi:hypothetical protein